MEGPWSERAPTNQVKEENVHVFVYTPTPTANFTPVCFLALCSLFPSIDQSINQSVFSAYLVQVSTRMVETGMPQCIAMSVLGVEI